MGYTPNPNHCKYYSLHFSEALAWVFQALNGNWHEVAYGSYGFLRLLSVLRTHTHTYVVLYICMHVCMYVWMHACMHACMHVCIDLVLTCLCRGCLWLRKPSNTGRVPSQLMASKASYIYIYIYIYIYM